MKPKYGINDLAHDIAYIAIFAGLILFLIGSYPELLDKLIHLHK